MNVDCKTHCLDVYIFLSKFWSFEWLYLENVPRLNVVYAIIK